MFKAIPSTRAPTLTARAARSHQRCISTLPPSTFKRLRPAQSSNCLAKPLQRSISAALEQPSASNYYIPELEGRRPLFRKILIANRGEIACRVIRTARKLGIKTVTIYSDADRNALHVQLADEAYYIGPAPSSESYLKMDTIIDVALNSGSQAIHPGYGFLSENAQFAKKLENAGIVFIGPPASAITSMGSKSESKDIMTRAGVPCVPGYHGNDQSPENLRSQAEKIGYPVLIKAILGGGGKGMRIVEDDAEFLDALESAKRESRKSFGDDNVLVEKYITQPRHIEVQVFGDMHGKVVSLWERDCSVQRRHQKIIEEAPAPGLASEVRQDLHQKAIAAAQAVNYVGAGTVEFIYDNTTAQFYFMEMNTRLQVEHPITEMITGQDLVQWQLEVASGNHIPLPQSDIACSGHAFEARIYAENPRNGFLPDVGPLIHIRKPDLSKAVRLDEGFLEGSNIEVFYDPLISKLIVHGNDRAEALRLLRQALSQYEIAALSTNIEFLRSLAEHPAFVNAELETGFIDRYRNQLFPSETEPTAEVILASALHCFLRSSSETPSPWSLGFGERLGSYNQPQEVVLRSTTKNPVDYKIAIHRVREGVYDATLTCEDSITSYSEVRASMTSVNSLRMEIDSGLSMFSVVPEKASIKSSTSHMNMDRIHIFYHGYRTTLLLPRPRWLAEETEETAAALGGGIKAPMPSLVVDVRAAAGSSVEKGQVVVVLESMKTEIVLRASQSGVVKAVNCKQGDMVAEGVELVLIDEH